MKTWIAEEPLKPEELQASVLDQGHGAMALFVGIVRATHEGRRVSAVSYEAFKPLAEKVLARIVREAERRFGARVAAAHRLGRLKVGEASVIVAAGSPHRGEAFEACRAAIEEIKARLPVWKKELYINGESRWLKGCSLATGHER